MDRIKKALGSEEEYRQIFENVQALRFFDGGNCVSYEPPEGEKTTIGYHVKSGKYKLCNGHMEDLAKGLEKVEIYGFEEHTKNEKKRGLILKHDGSTLFLNFQADCNKHGTSVTGKMVMGLKSALENEIEKSHSSEPIEKPNYLPDEIMASA